MTDETDKTSAEPAGNEPTGSEPARSTNWDGDWILADLVEMQNSSESDGIPLWITLMVKGSIVSGKLINGKSYFEQYGDFWADLVDDEMREDVREYYAQPAKMYGPEGDRATPPNYIHLAEARVFAHGGNPIPGNQGVFWRGRIASVDAFWIGQLKAETSNV